MQEYKILIPIGGHLPSVGDVINAGDNFKGTKENILVAAINSITWGTKRIDDADKVAGVFVELYGSPYPAIKLTKEQEKAHAKYKHFVVHDAATGEMTTCFNGDDLVTEVPQKKCPMCEKKEQIQEEKTKTDDALGGLQLSIQDFAYTMAERGIPVTDCTCWADLVERIQAAAKGEEVTT